MRRCLRGVLELASRSALLRMRGPQPWGLGLSLHCNVEARTRLSTKPEAIDSISGGPGDELSDRTDRIRRTTHVRYPLRADALHLDLGRPRASARSGDPPGGPRRRPMGVIRPERRCGGHPSGAGPFVGCPLRRSGAGAEAHRRHRQPTSAALPGRGDRSCPVRPLRRCVVRRRACARLRLRRRADPRTRLPGRVDVDGPRGTGRGAGARGRDARVRKSAQRVPVLRQHRVGLGRHCAR